MAPTPWARSQNSYSATTTRTGWESQAGAQQQLQQQQHGQLQQHGQDNFSDGNSSGFQSPLPSSQASGQYGGAQNQSVNEQQYTSSYKISGSGSGAQQLPAQQFHLQADGSGPAGLPTSLHFNAAGANVHMKNVQGGDVQNYQAPGQGFTNNQSDQWETRNPDGSVTKHQRTTSSTRKVFNSLQGLDQNGSNGFQSPSPDFSAQQQQGGAQNNSSQYNQKLTTSTTGQQQNQQYGQQATANMPQGPSLVASKGQQPQTWQPSGQQGNVSQNSSFNSSTTSSSHTTQGQQQAASGAGQSVQWPPGSPAGGKPQPWNQQQQQQGGQQQYNQQSSINQQQASQATHPSSPSPAIAPPSRHPGSTPMYNSAQKAQQQQSTFSATQSTQNNNQNSTLYGTSTPQPYGGGQQQQPLAGDNAKHAIPVSLGQTPPDAGERGSIFGNRTKDVNAAPHVPVGVNPKGYGVDYSAKGGAQPQNLNQMYGNQQQQQHTSSSTTQYNQPMQQGYNAVQRAQTPPVPPKPTGQNQPQQQPQQYNTTTQQHTSSTTTQYGQQQPGGAGPQSASPPAGLSATQLAYLQQQRKSIQSLEQAEHGHQASTVRTNYQQTQQNSTTNTGQQHQQQTYQQSQQNDNVYGRQQNQPGQQPQGGPTSPTSQQPQYNANATIHQPQQHQQQQQHNQSASATLNYQQQQNKQQQQTNQTSSATLNYQQQNGHPGSPASPQPSNAYSPSANLLQQGNQQNQQQQQHGQFTASTNINKQQQNQQQQQNQYSTSHTLQANKQQQQTNQQQNQQHVQFANTTQQQQQANRNQQQQQYSSGASTNYQGSNSLLQQNQSGIRSEVEQTDVSQKKGQQVWQDQQLSYAQGRQQQTGGTSAGNAPPAWLKQRGFQVNQKDNVAWSEAQLHKVGRSGAATTAEQQSTLQASMYEDDTPRPTLTQQLEQSYSVRYNDRAHFEITLAPELVGEPSLKVEWFLNGQPLRPSPNVIVQETYGKCSCDVLTTTEQYSGSYEVHVSTASGQTTSSTFLTVGEAPQHPQAGLSTSEWLDGGIQQGTGRYIKEDIKEEKSIDAPRFVDRLPETMLIEEGEPLRLQTNLQPPNDPTMRIEWSFNGKPLMQGSRTATFCDFGLITLSVLDTRQDDSGEYTCRAYNQLGTAETTSRITCAPRGKSQMKPMLQEPLVMSPASGDINEGDTLHFEARIEPRTDPYLTIQWYHNGRPISEGSRFRPNYDFGFATLDIGSIISEDQGSITLVVRNTMGETSESIQIPAIEPRQRVVTTTQHPEANAKIPQLEYKDFTRTYEYNETSIHEPRFASQLPPHLQIDEGQPLSLSVQLEPKGDPNMQVQWMFNGKALSSGNRVKTTYDFGTATLYIDSAWAHDSGEYVVIATNPHGSQQMTCTIFIENKSGVDSTTQNQASVAKIQDLEAYMYANDVVEGSFQAEPRAAPQIIEQFTQITQEVREGQALHVEGRLSPADDPSLKVDWFFNGQALRASNRFRTSYDFGLVMFDVTYVIPEDSGVYTMRAHNETGEVIHEFSLDIKARRSIITDVQAPAGIAKIQELEDMLNYRAPEALDIKNTQAPVFTKPLLGPQGKLKEGQCVHMEASLLPVGDPLLTVEWYHNGYPLVTGTRMRATHELDYVALDIDYIYPRDAGDYTCRAKNDMGQTESTYTVYCFPRRNVITESINPNSLQQIQKLEAFM